MSEEIIVSNWLKHLLYLQMTACIVDKSNSSVDESFYQ